MPYKVCDNDDMNVLDRKSDKSRYSTMIENALNVMEADGFNLVGIEQASDLDSPESYYIFHKKLQPGEVWEDWKNRQGF